MAGTYLLEIIDRVDPTKDKQIYKVTVKAGESLYGAMRRLEADDATEFTFKTTGDSPNRRITEINGLEEDTNRSNRWKLFLDDKDTPLKTRVEDDYPKDGEKRIFCFTAVPEKPTK